MLQALFAILIKSFEKIQSPLRHHPVVHPDSLVLRPNRTIPTRPESEFLHSFADL